MWTPLNGELQKQNCKTEAESNLKQKQAHLKLAEGMLYSEV